MILEYYFCSFTNNRIILSAVKTLFKIKWVLLSYQIVSGNFFIFYMLLQSLIVLGQTHQTMLTMVYFVGYVPKLVLLVVMFEDIFRIGTGAVNYFRDTRRLNSEEENL
jgi:hypothetical protein